MASYAEELLTRLAEDTPINRNPLSEVIKSKSLI